MKQLTRSTGIFYGLLLIALVAIGYFREYVFVTINFQMYRIYYQVYSDYPLPNNLKFLDNFNSTQLYYTKWVLTLLFTLIYFFITLFTLYKVIGKTQAIKRITIGLHLLLIIIAGICYSYDLIFTNTNYRGYELSRTFMGYLQSPLVLMLLIPTFKLSDKLSDKTRE